MKKVVAVLLVVCFLLYIPAEVYVYADTISLINQENQINELFDERAKLIAKGKYDEISKIESQLSALGVNKVESSEILTEYGENLMITANDMIRSADDVDWFTTTQEYKFSGSIYIIETITAQPKKASSCLMNTDDVVVEAGLDLEAGVIEFIDIIVEEIISGLISDIENANLFLTLYNAIVSVVEAVTPQTIITDAEVLFSYINTTTVQFKFVNGKGMSDMTKILATRGTRCVTDIGWQFRKIDSEDISNSEIIQGQDTIVSLPGGYGSNMNAIRVFLGQEDIPIRAFVYSIKIDLLNSNKSITIRPARPDTPLKVY